MREVGEVLYLGIVDLLLLVVLHACDLTLAFDLPPPSECGDSKVEESNGEQRIQDLGCKCLEQRWLDCQFEGLVSLWTVIPDYTDIEYITAGFDTCECGAVAEGCAAERLSLVFQGIIVLRSEDARVYRSSESYLKGRNVVVSDLDAVGSIIGVSGSCKLCLLVQCPGSDACNEKVAVGGLRLEKGGGEGDESVGRPHVYSTIGCSICCSVRILVDGNMRLFEIGCGEPFGLRIQLGQAMRCGYP